MSISGSERKTYPSKVCVLSVHEESFSKENILFNSTKFPDGTLLAGHLARLVPFAPSTAVRDFTRTDPKDELPKTKPNEDRPFASNGSSFKTSRVKIDSETSQIRANDTVDYRKEFVFKAVDLTPEQKARAPTVQLSVSTTIQKLFKFRRYMQVQVSLVDEDIYTASHVEIIFRDEYLARADMWRLALSELSGNSLYRGQSILFMGTIKVTIKNIYIQGEKVTSALFSSQTKPIFRSESARYVLFIQMSREMWEFDARGTGELMFSKVVNGFLPQLFRRWLHMKARHLVSIILFTRMEYSHSTTSNGPAFRISDSGSMANNTRDYYRVVVNEMASGSWLEILYRLRREYKIFLRDVSTLSGVDPMVCRLPAFHDKPAEERPEYVIAGEPTAAMHSNVLEAINLASAQFANDYIDRDLVRTGISIIIITPGTGLFEVDYSMLKLTTDMLVENGIGIDLVCLAPMPLHSVPLFQYRNPTIATADIESHSKTIDIGNENTPRQGNPIFGSYPSRNYGISPLKNADYASGSVLYHGKESKPGDWSYAVPHWIDISFWTGSAEVPFDTNRPLDYASRLERHVNTLRSRFDLRVNLTELQTMAIMDNEMSHISIAYLRQNLFHPSNRSLLDPNDSVRSKVEPDALVSLPGSFSQTNYDSDHSGSPTTMIKRPLHGKVTDQEKRMLRWMDDYDTAVFVSSEQKQILEREASQRDRLESSHKRHHHQVDESVLLSTSFSDHGSPERHFDPPGGTYFDRQMRERGLRSGAVNPRRKESMTSMSSALLGDRPKAGKLSRQISFGLRGFEAPKTTASTSVTLPSDLQGQQGPTLTRGFKVGSNTKSEHPSAIARQFRETLRRQPSSPGQPSTPTEKTSTSKASSQTLMQDSKTAQDSKAMQASRDASPGQASQPIAIRNAANTLDAHNREDRHATDTEDGGSKASVSSRIGEAFHHASVARNAGPRLDLVSSDRVREPPKTLSPLSALSPWLTLVNPSNPKKNDINIANQFRRWQHVFPHPLKATSIRWKSLCSPASVPLTSEFFPTAGQMATEYELRPYQVFPDEEEEVSEVPRTRENLLRELIAFRLSHGFQVVGGPAVADFVGKGVTVLLDIFKNDFTAADGSMVFMSAGNTIHQIVCVENKAIEVRRYHRKPAVAVVSDNNIDKGVVYRPVIRTAFANAYTERPVLLKSVSQEYKWDKIDHFLSGYEDSFSESLKFWRARFVLIPIEPPVTSTRPLQTLPEDSEEEIRLEGIQRLTQMWNKYRYVPPNERRFQQPLRMRKDPNPLAIEYQTRDPSVVVATLPEIDAGENDPNVLSSSLFPESERYSGANCDLNKLAQDIQGEKGIKMIDRRWHWRLYYNCFTGTDLTNWIQMNFRDIETRNEAVDLGNQLMSQGLFQHVQKRHAFRDGNYFYQLASEFRAPRPESRSGWFGTRRSEKSVPPTPMAEAPKSSPFAATPKGRPNTANSSEGSGEKTPTQAESARKVMLSASLRYDVDHRKKSYRPEIINLHYDRVHNPENCYHIRIDWMNVTSKLIEDAIVQWATMVERFGLRLVEVPIAEACAVMEGHPFRSPYMIKLAAQPPDNVPQQYFDSNSFTPQTQLDRLAYHKALLRKLNFVLDYEAASSFPPDVPVEYSWGKPDYRYSQFIHKTGLLIVQITDEGDFLVMANRLCNNRAAAARVNKFDKNADHHDRRGVTALYELQNGNPTLSPMSSPLVRAVPDPPMTLGPTTLVEEQDKAVTAEDIKDVLERFCHDGASLRDFYRSALKPNPSPSPRIAPMVNSAIPDFGLPPAITIRDASPQPAVGASYLTVHGSRHSSIQSPLSIEENVEPD